MNQRFRIAVVGTGQIAAHGHLPAVLSSEVAELVALVDVAPSRARALADEFGVHPIIAESIGEVADRVDGVIIATPNHTHRSIAVACLREGLPVLIEKPLAASVEDGEKIVEAAERYDTIAAVGYCTRFHQNVSLLGSLLADGHFGRVRRWVYQWGVRDWNAPLTGYSFSREAAGGGVLIVNGSHFLDRMLQWFGYPSRFEYFDDSMGGPEATAVAKFFFESGSVTPEGLIRLSKAFRLSSGFVMETEAGTVKLPDEPHADVTFRPAERPDVQMTIRSSATVSRPEPKPFQLQLEDFVDACRRTRTPLVPARDGLTSLRLIEGLYRRRQPLEEAYLQREILQ